MGNENSGLTVGELKRELEGWSDDMVLHMGGLTFYRMKQRGEKLLQMEFNQTVYLDGNGVVQVNDASPSE
jgi:hypothetical protein